MPFDANLILVDGSADWSYTNLDTGTYGQPISTTRNAGGFTVVDLVTEGPVSGLAAVMVFTEAAAASSDTLTAIIEECDDYDFSTSQPHELAKFDIAAVTKGVILGSEITSAGAVVLRRISPTRRYVRCKANCGNAGDDFGVVYCYLSPYGWKNL